MSNPIIGSDFNTISDTFVSTTSSLPFLISFSGGRLSSLGKSETSYDDSGQNLVHIDQNGDPIMSADGTIPQKIDNGRYFYLYESQNGKSTFSNIVDSDLHLRNDSNQVLLNGRGRPVNVDNFGKSSSKENHKNHTWDMDMTWRYHASTPFG